MRKLGCLAAVVVIVTIVVMALSPSRDGKQPGLKSRVTPKPLITPPTSGTLTQAVAATLPETQAVDPVANPPIAKPLQNLTQIEQLRDVIGAIKHTLDDVAKANAGTFDGQVLAIMKTNLQAKLQKHRGILDQYFQEMAVYESLDRALSAVVKIAQTLEIDGTAKGQIENDLIVANTLLVAPEKQIKAALAEAEQRRREREAAQRERAAFLAKINEPISNLKIGAAGLTGTYKVLQVIDDTSALVTLSRFNDDVVMLVGINTTSMADGMSYAHKNPFVILETVRYGTALGTTRQVFVLQPFKVENDQ